MRALVTGGSRGLGRAVAEAYAREGAALVVTATGRRHLEATLGACREAGADVHPVGMDLGDPGSVAQGAAQAVAALGGLDVLVNNAGLLGVRRPLAEYPLEEWRRVLEVGVTGTLLLIQAVLPALRDGGAIVNVTSGAAGRPTWGAYSVAKLALDGMTDMLRVELAGRDIRCVAINPGPARTAMRAAAYPDEDPETVPLPSSLTEPFVAVAAGADPGGRVEAAGWRTA